MSDNEEKKVSENSVFIEFCKLGDPVTAPVSTVNLEEDVSFPDTKVTQEVDCDFSLNIENLKDKRKERRYPLVSPIMMRADGSSLLAKGKGIDLSATAIGLKLKGEGLKLGQHYFLEFLGSGHLRPFSVTCELVKLGEEMDEDGYISAGLVFVKASKLNERTIAEYIESAKEMYDKWKVRD